MCRPLLSFLLSLGIFSLLNAQTNNAAIFDAIKNNDIKQLRSLLKEGADPNAVDEDGDHLLMYAALNASADCMQLLLEKGSNANAINKADETALMWSVHDIAKMKLLVQHGADVNAKAKSGNTPLLIAAVGTGNYENVKFLIDNGADPLALNNRKENALIRAASFSDTATISLLLGKGLPLDAITVDSSVALLNAAMNVNRPVVLQLLERGADPDQKCFLGFTPLFAAAIFYDHESAMALLKKSKNINALDGGGNSLLMWATYNEHDNVDFIQALLDKGADVNIKSKTGATVLDWAMKKGNTATVALLKRTGAK